MIQPTYPELHDPGLRKFVYRRALETYGKFNQLIVANEELGELSKEICKVLRGIGSIDNLTEEIADVRIMVEQLEMIFDCHEDVEAVMVLKAERLTHKLDRDEKKENLCEKCVYREECEFPKIHPTIKLRACNDYEEDHGETDT
jgi:hypothetical protein